MKGEKCTQNFEEDTSCNGAAWNIERRQEDTIKIDFLKVWVKMGAFLHTTDSGLRQMAGDGIHSVELSGSYCRSVK
jgi:hypothetical protein